MATCSSILAWRMPWTENPGRLHTVHGVAQSQTQLTTEQHTQYYAQLGKDSASLQFQKQCLTE